MTPDSQQPQKPKRLLKKKKRAIHKASSVLSHTTWQQLFFRWFLESLDTNSYYAKAHATSVWPELHASVYVLLVYKLRACVFVVLVIRGLCVWGGGTGGVFLFWGIFQTP